MKPLLRLILLFAITAIPSTHAAEAKPPVTIMVAAAASLHYSNVQELIPMFQVQFPWITVDGTYDSSGKLQAQIENGLEADVFMSAATKQMDALVDKGFIDRAGVVELLENKIVLIQPSNAAATVLRFEDAANAGMVAVGDPDSVPAGQYAREAFTSLGIWDEIKGRASFGTNVTEVLNWVAEGSADVGVVYATDAATTARVKVVCEAPAGALKRKVIYPVAVLKNSRHAEAAGLFVDFLASDPALAVFAKYGFAASQ